LKEVLTLKVGIEKRWLPTLFHG